MRPPPPTPGPPNAGWQLLPYCSTLDTPRALRRLAMTATPLSPLVRYCTVDSDMKGTRGGVIGTLLGCVAIGALGLSIIFAIARFTDSPKASSPSVAASVPSTDPSLSVRASVPSTNRSSSVSASVRGTEKPGSASLLLPADETELISTVAYSKTEYDGAQNEFQKSAIRRQRAEALARIFPNRAAIEWIGTISSMQTTSDGQGILAVKLLGDKAITIRTSSTGLSDAFTGTLIPAGSPLYDEISRLSVGQNVVFSGTFGLGELDYLNESSITEAGSMNEPEFIFRFASVRPVGSSRADASAQAKIESEDASSPLDAPAALPPAATVTRAPLFDPSTPQPSAPLQPVLISRVEPEYSAEARRANFNGDVRASIDIDERGRVTSVTVIDSPGLGLDQKFIDAVRQWRFRPAMRDGVAVSSTGTVTLTFRSF